MLYVVALGPRHYCIKRAVWGETLGSQISSTNAFGTQEKQAFGNSQESVSGTHSSRKIDRDHVAPIAQSVERGPYESKVESSSLPGSNCFPPPRIITRQICSVRLAEGMWSFCQMPIHICCQWLRKHSDLLFPALQRTCKAYMQTIMPWNTGQLRDSCLIVRSATGTAHFYGLLSLSCSMLSDRSFLSSFEVVYLLTYYSRVVTQSFA